MRCVEWCRRDASFPLYVRALESQRPDALLKDEKAVAFVSQMGAALARIQRVRLDEDDKTVLVLRHRQFDRQVSNFLSRKKDTVVVAIGCGLDARFERVDDGSVEWFDLDLPEVIELRRKFIGADRQRYHLLPYSMFDFAWMTEVRKIAGRTHLFLAEGVFMYFEETQMRTLVRTLQEQFPQAELVFDAFSPFLVRANNLRFKLSGARIGARYKWGLKRASDLTRWSEGIRLTQEWYPYDSNEPRLTRSPLVRIFPWLASSLTA